MWGGSQAYINVSFDNASPGHLAMVIYEWTENILFTTIIDGT
jgi:hypothetical protein